MFRYFLITLFLITAHCCLVKEPEQKFSEKTIECIQDAMQQSGDGVLTSYIQSKNFQKAAECLNSYLKEQAKGETLEVAVREYLTSHHLTGTIDIKQMAEEQGLSGNPVLMVKVNGKPWGVIKAYQGVSKEMVKDFWGQYAARRLQLKSMGVPEILDVGKIQVQDKSYLIFVQEYVVGKDLWYLLDPLGNNKSEEEKRNGMLRAEKVVKLLGKGLREYHEKSSWKKAPLPSFIEGDIDWNVEEGIKNLRQHPEMNLDPAVVEKKWKQLKPSVKKHDFSWSYTHGDAHFGNFLYNEETSTLFIIDFGNGAKYIDASFHGFGVPYPDFVKIVETIRSKAYRVPQKEVERLVDVFAKAYGTITVDDPIYRYFFIYHTMGILNWYLDVKETLPEKVRQSQERSLRMRLKRIRHMQVQGLLRS